MHFPVKLQHGGDVIDWKIGLSIRTQEIGGVSLSVKCWPIRTQEIGGGLLSDILYLKECLLYSAAITF